MIPSWREYAEMVVPSAVVERMTVSPLASRPPFWRGTDARLRSTMYDQIEAFEPSVVVCVFHLTRRRSSVATVASRVPGCSVRKLSLLDN